MGTVEMEKPPNIVEMGTGLAGILSAIRERAREIFRELDPSAAAIGRAIINTRAIRGSRAWWAGKPGRLADRERATRADVVRATRERITGAKLEWTRYKQWCQQSEDELGIIANIVSNRLSQLSFDAIAMAFNGDKRIKRLRMVKWAELEYTPDQYRLKVDSLTLPRGRGITEDAMGKPEVVKSLGLSVGKPVTAQLVEGVGMWFLVDREHGVGNIPKYCTYKDVVEQAIARGKIGLVQIPVGFTAGRRLAVLDFHDEMTAHLLIGGAPGGGKSSLLHVIICHLIQQSPERVKMRLFDFKRVELRAYYGQAPHLVHEIITEPDKFLPSIREVRADIDKRYSIMAAAKVEHIKDYNAHRTVKIPDVFVIVDELASIYLNPMISAKDKSEIDGHLGFIAMQARACGVHLILATQRPDRNVLSGYIRACMAGKIAYACASVQESMIILGTGHAAFKDSVPLGRAIMIRGRFEIPFQTAWISKPQRREIAGLAGAVDARLIEQQAELEPEPTANGVTIQELAQYALNNFDGNFNTDNLYNVFRDRGARLHQIRLMSNHFRENYFYISDKQYILKTDGYKRPVFVVERRQTSDVNVFRQETDVMTSDVTDDDQEYTDWAARMGELGIAPEPVDDTDDLNAYERAGKVAVELVETGEMTNARARELTGLSRQGALKLFDSLGRAALPLIYDESDQKWSLLDDHDN